MPKKMKQGVSFSVTPKQAATIAFREMGFLCGLRAAEPLSQWSRASGEIFR